MMDMLDSRRNRETGSRPRETQTDMPHSRKSSAGVKPKESRRRGESFPVDGESKFKISPLQKEDEGVISPPSTRYYSSSVQSYEAEEAAKRTNPLRTCFCVDLVLYRNHHRKG